MAASALIHAYVLSWSLVICLSAAPLLAQRGELLDAQKNPFAGNDAASAAGAVLYQKTCQSCHGGAAQGDRGPALATGNFRHGSEDSDLFQNIRNGIPATQMPSFSALPTDDIWRIITYLRSLNGNAAAANEVVPGDVAAGEETFWSKGGCGKCHEVNGRGGNLGPDLSAVGTNSADYLHRVILDPNGSASIEVRWFGPNGISVKTRDGEEIRGIKRSEDNFTLIMTDETGKLRRFDKQDLVKEHAEPLMPDNYSKVLAPAEVQNLVAYLKSLKVRDLSKTIQSDLPGGLSFTRLRNARAEPQNWLTYWG